MEEGHSEPLEGLKPLGSAGDGGEMPTVFSFSSLTSVALILFILAALLAAGSVVYARQKIPRNIARVMSDHRSMGLSIEMYWIDNMTYPPMAKDPSRALGVERLPPDYPAYRTYDMIGPSRRCPLTTPVAYMVSIPSDPFADVWGTPYPYVATVRCLMFGSWGPDRDQKEGGDLQWQLGDFTFPELTRAYLDAKAKNQRAGLPPNTPISPDIRQWTVNPDCPLEELMISDESDVFRRKNPALMAGNGDKYGQGAYVYDPTNGAISQGDIVRTRN